MNPLNIFLIAVGVALGVNFVFGLLLYAANTKLKYDRVAEMAAQETNGTIKKSLNALKRHIVAGFGRTLLRLAAAGGVVYLALRIFGVM